jgi:hypothetical protein
MAFADSSFAELYLVEEDSWGVIPTPTPTLQTIRVTGESLGQATTMESSQEIRADRQVPSLIRTDVSASGDINFELAYASLNEILEGALMSTWGSAAATTGTDTITVANSGSTYTRGGGDFTTDGFSEGMWVKWEGFSEAANNGYHRITTLTATVMTCAGSTLTDEGPTALGSGTPALAASNDGMIRNGTTKKSYVIEKKFSDVTEFISFTGMRVGSFSLNVAPGAIITGSASFMGKSATPAQATVGDTTPTAAGTQDVMSAIDNIYAIREGGSATGMSLTSLSFSIDNALRPQPAIGNLGPVGIGIGRISLTGTVEAYFEDDTFLDKYIDFTTTSFDFRCEDAAGNAMIWNINNAKLSDAQVVAGGIDQDVLVSASFEAFLDSTTKMIQVDRFTA